MKKTLLIIGSILFLIFLGVNGVRMQIGRFKSEKQTFIDELHLEFSGSVDSIRVLGQNLGVIIVHLTDGEVDSTREVTLRKALKHNDGLRFLRYKTTDAIKILSHESKKYKAGDSIRINTDENIIRIFRKGEKVGESTIENSLRGG
ncbi:MAG TPA: hypothetical protein PLR06_02390 [Cyclobacteriaceae bacterium]|nr:hypothetical protein [Cyclobacteriaceae bacterium]